MGLLTPNPKIAEGFKHGEFDLPDALGTTRLTIHEHSGGHLTLLISQRHGEPVARYDVLSMLGDATDELRRLLNRAYRERARARSGWLAEAGPRRRAREEKT